MIRARATTFGVAAAAALAFAPTAAHAGGTRSCAPTGASVIRTDSSYSLYRYLRGPITACKGKTKHSEVGGWHDDSKPPLPWPRRTHLAAAAGDCVALSEFRGTPYGGTDTVTVINLETRTRWSLGTYTVSQFTSSRLGSLSLAADCSATWSVTEVTVGGAATVRQASLPAPANAGPLKTRRGVRPKVRRPPTLSRDRLGRVVLKVRLNRAPRAVTAVIAGKHVAIRTTATSASLRLPRRASRSFKRGRRYQVKVIACNDGCAGSTRRASLR